LGECHAKTGTEKIQFVSDSLVTQIIEGRKTASVTTIEGQKETDEFDDPLWVGEYYRVFDSGGTPRVTIRVVAMELCRWDAIPERLWKGETNSDADGFRADHLGFFDHPADDFEFIAYYFEKAGE
jgi:uncharacterized protein YhfF